MGSVLLAPEMWVKTTLLVTRRTSWCPASQCDDKLCCPGHHRLTRKLCLECVSRAEEEKEVFVSPSHTVRLVAMKTVLGKLRSPQDHTEECQSHCSGTLSGENSSQISFAWFGERI